MILETKNKDTLSTRVFMYRLQSYYNELVENNLYNEIDINNALKEIVNKIFEEYNVDTTILNKLSEYFYLEIIHDDTTIELVTADKDMGYDIEDINGKIVHLIPDNNGVHINMSDNIKCKYYTNTDIITIFCRFKDGSMSLSGHSNHIYLFTINIENRKIVSIEPHYDKIANMNGNLINYLLNLILYLITYELRQILNYLADCIMLIKYKDINNFNTSLYKLYFASQIHYNTKYISYCKYVKLNNVFKRVVKLLKIFPLTIEINNFKSLYTLLTTMSEIRRCVESVEFFKLGGMTGV